VFAASHLLIIQLCLKNDTKYLYFSLTPCIHWFIVYSLIHCSKSIKNSTIVGFMYKHISYNNNFTLIIYNTLTSSDLEWVVMMEQLTALIIQYLHVSQWMLWDRIMRLPRLIAISTSKDPRQFRCPRTLSMHISSSKYEVYSEVSKMYENAL